MMTRPGAASYVPAGAPATGQLPPFSTGVKSLTDLASISTVNLLLPAVCQWISATDGTFQVWELFAATASTGPGVQQPNDYNAVTNAKVWFKAST